MNKKNLTAALLVFAGFVAGIGLLISSDTASARISNPSSAGSSFTDITATGTSTLNGVVLSTAYAASSAGITVFSSNATQILSLGAGGGSNAAFSGGVTFPGGIWTSAGDVGIGTSSPYSKLSVAGQVVGQNFIATSTTATSTFASAVYIATSTGQAKLEVNGTIRAAHKDVTDAANIRLNWLEGNAQTVILGGNRTIYFDNVLKGSSMRLLVCQDNTGSRTVTWSTTSPAIRWSGGSAPTLTTTGHKCDALSFFTATSSSMLFGGAAANY